MAITLGLLATLEAQVGKGEELADFLKQGQALVEDEPGTLVWYAFKVDDTHYGIFDAFADEDGRQAHVTGKVPEALGGIRQSILAADPDIRPVDVLATKQPS